MTTRIEYPLVTLNQIRFESLIDGKAGQGHCHSRASPFHLCQPDHQPVAVLRPFDGQHKYVLGVHLAETAGRALAPLMSPDDA